MQKIEFTQRTGIELTDEQYKQVEDMYLKAGNNWNFPIAKIQLHSKDLYVDFKATYEDAVKLGEEIARRWNECNTKL